MLSLFSGIGGIDLAAQWAGIDTIAFCEINPFCQKVLNKHWPGVKIYDDIRTVTREALQKDGIETIDIVAGGFPCQPFSTAGKQRGKEDDRNLWPEMFRVIQEVRPRWVVGENVANFVNMALDDTLSNLESIGYETASFIIPACAVGAHHRRDRLFIIANSNTVRCDVRRLKGQGIQRENQTCNEIDTGGEDVAHSNGMRKLQSERGIENFGGWACNSGWWKIEPKLDRVAYGVPDWVHRLKSLGNAVVPQQIYPIFKAIMDIEAISNIARR